MSTGREIVNSRRMMIVGSALGRPGAVQAPVLVQNNLTVNGFSIHATVTRNADSLRGSTTELLGLLQQRKIQAVISRTYSLIDAAAAHHYMESRAS